MYINEIINIKANETPAEFTKGLTKTTRKVTKMDRDGWPYETTEEVWIAEDGNLWKVATDRDGWLMKYPIH